MATTFPDPAALLSHRPPMLLLEVVLAHEPAATVCAARFNRAFAEACGGEVSAAFGLELIAQAAAVHHGLRQRAVGQLHPPATRGLLLGSRRLSLAGGTLPIGETLRVTVVDGGGEPNTGGMIRFEGRVETTTGETLVSGDVTVLETRPDDAPLA